MQIFNYTPVPRRGRGVYCFTSVCLSVLLSSKICFRRIFLSNCWWKKSDIWSQASYRYTILWEVFLDPSDSYFLFADYTHWTYMHIFRCIFLCNYWWQKSDIWSQASYRYPISWEAFFDPSDSYFLFAKERGYHRWTLAHSSSSWWKYTCLFKNKVEVVQVLLSRITFEFLTIFLLIMMHNPPPKKGLKHTT